MRFDRFTSALALGHVVEALQALFGPVEANWCNNKSCSPGNNNCAAGCTCRHGSCRGTK